MTTSSIGTGDGLAQPVDLSLEWREGDRLGSHGKVVRLRLITCILSGQPTKYIKYDGATNR